MASVDRCVCCGNYVPEGRQVCTSCADKDRDRTSLYDEVCSTLTDFEHPEDNEYRSSTVWNDVFYRLLRKVQNAFERSVFE